MTPSRSQIEKLCAEGAKRVLARAIDNYGVMNQHLAQRIYAAVEKYILKHEEKPSPKIVSEFVDSLQGDDLCLILACELGNEKAWSDLVERFSVTVRSAARSASSNEEGAEDLSQSIWAELHGLKNREDGRPAGKLAYYSGRGSLAGWLRAVVSQLAIDQHRKQSRFVQTEEDADFDRMASQGHDGTDWTSQTANSPEVELSKRVAGNEMQKALATSIKKLAAEDRLLVKLYYFDGLRLKEAGAVLGVHEATASRRLARIHGDLRQQVESELINEKGWTKDETARAFAELGLHLEADIEPLVTAEPALIKNGNRAPLKG